MDGLVAPGFSSPPVWSSVSPSVPVSSPASVPVSVSVSVPAPVSAPSPSSVLWEADAEGAVPVPSDSSDEVSPVSVSSETLALGAGEVLSVANAAGAESRASGARTAVAAAVAMARRIFMKTSRSPECCGAAARVGGRLRVWGAVVALDSAALISDSCEWLRQN